MKRRIAVWLGRSSENRSTSVWHHYLLCILFLWGIKPKVSENGFQTTFELFAVGVDPLPLFAQGVFEGFLFFLRAVEAVGQAVVVDGDRRVLYRASDFERNGFVLRVQGIADEQVLR